MKGSLKDYMYSRAKIGAPKGNLGGENPIRKTIPYPKSEINSKKLEVETKSISDPDEKRDTNERVYENWQKDEYEKGLLRKEINLMKKRETALGGAKNVTKKIKRRAKFKKALDDTIMFLGSN